MASVSNRFLRVSLLRLPISLPSCGQPLPEFHFTTNSSADHTFVEKTHWGEVSSTLSLKQFGTIEE